MSQGVLPFRYEVEKREEGMTALAWLPLYLDVAHGVVMSGCVTVHDGVFIGAGSVILPRKTIGAWAIVGAGAVVTRDVPAGAVVVGNPAQIIRVRESALTDGNPFS